MALHFGIGHLPHSYSCSQAGTATGCKEATGDRCSHGQTAFELSYPGTCCLIYFLTNTATRNDGAHKQEKGDHGKGVVSNPIKRDEGHTGEGRSRTNNHSQADKAYQD